MNNSFKNRTKLPSDFDLWNYNENFTKQVKSSFFEFQADWIGQKESQSPPKYRKTKDKNHQDIQLQKRENLSKI